MEYELVEPKDSQVEQVEHDARTCFLCCPYGLSPGEVEERYVQEALKRLADSTARNWPEFQEYWT